MKSAFKFATAKISNQPGIIQGTKWIWKKHRTLAAARRVLDKELAGLDYMIIGLEDYDVRGNYAVPRK